MGEELRARLSIPDREQRTFLLLQAMREHGQGVSVGWGEDDGKWACSWIRGGERFTSHNRHLEDAVELTARKGYDRIRS